MFGKRKLKYSLKQIYEDSFLTYKTVNPSKVITYIYDYCANRNIEVFNLKEENYSDTFYWTFKHCTRADITRLVYYLHKDFDDLIENISY